MSGFYGNTRTYKTYRRSLKKKKAGKIVFFVFLFFLVYNVTTSFFIKSYRSGSASMEPSLPRGSFFFASGLPFGAKLPFVNQKIPALRLPRRGDVVVLTPSYIEPSSWYKNFLDEVVGFFTLQRISLKVSAKKDWENQELVKRVVALPGDTVRVQNYRVFIRPAGEGRFLPEDAFYSEAVLTYPDFPDNWVFSHPFSGNWEERVLGDDEYFLLSDKRGRGSDSLDWGTVGKDRIERKVIFRYWPKPGRVY